MGTEEKADEKVDGVNDNKDKERKCFIITPIGNSDSEIFRHINGVIQSVIRPVLEGCGFSDIRAAHEISEPGSINNQLVNRIINDDLVIANLTDKNPNVMYELCLRHAVAKPVIHICEEGTSLPFDIKGERTIYYTNDMYGVNELKRELINAMNSIDYEKEYKDNPIYTAVSIDNILKEADTQEAISMVIKMLEGVSNQLSFNTLIRRENKSSYHEKYNVIVQLLNCTKIDAAGEFLESLPNNIAMTKSFNISDINRLFNSFNVTFYSEQEMHKGTEYLHQLGKTKGIEMSFTII
ncbi:MAG: hypothetical protein ACK5H4_12075 [Lacrimispora sphenoides]